MIHRVMRTKVLLITYTPIKTQLRNLIKPMLLNQNFAHLKETFKQLKVLLHIRLKCNKKNYFLRTAEINFLSTSACPKL